MNEQSDVIKKSDSKSTEEGKKLIIVIESSEMKFISISQNPSEKKRIKNT
jgi:hypothetical protein